MSFFKFLVFFFLFFVLGHSSFSQKEGLRFYNISREDGLSQSSVKCIFQDHYGFMWFGTYDGLNRYNGYEIEVFSHDSKDTTTISNNMIHCLLESSDSVLWVGTGKGLNAYEPGTGSFNRYSINGLFPTIYSLFEDSRKDFWAGTGNGNLIRIEKKWDSVRLINEEFKRGPKDRIIDIKEWDKNHLLLVYYRNGIFLYNKNRKEINPYIGDKDLKGTLITSLFKDSDGDYWVTTKTAGVFLFNKNGDIIFQYRDSLAPGNPVFNVIWDVIEAKKGEIWMASDGGGIIVYDKKNQKISRILSSTKNKNSLSNNDVFSFFKEKNSGIWVGTVDGGVDHVVSGWPFEAYSYLDGDEQGLSNPSVLSIHQDSKERIWMGTDGGGLNLFLPDAKKFLHYDKILRSPERIMSLGENSLGNLLLGTFKDGLIIFNPVKGRFSHGTKNNLFGSVKGDKIWSIYKDNGDNIWIGANNLNCLNEKLGSAIQFSNESFNPAPDQVITACETRHNQIFFGTINGLYRYDRDKRQFKKYTSNPQDEKSLTGRVVYSICEDQEGRIWMGTNEGLNLFNIEKEEFIHYTQSDGLPNNSIKSILEDKKGFLWLGTNNGLSKFDPTVGNFYNYDVSHGLQGNEFNRNSALVSKKGKFYFGGKKGFTCFFPDRVKTIPRDIPVLIEDLKIFNRSVEVGDEKSPLTQYIGDTKEITLNHHQSVFSFEFGAPVYDLSGEIMYAYKLEGLEEEWNTGYNRIATYTNLKPGNYVFQVKATNIPDVWSHSATSITIKVLPPWWKTWWFILIALVTLGSAIYFLTLNILHMLKLENQLEYERMNREKLNELNQMKLRFFTNISHELRTPLTLIYSPLKRFAGKRPSEDEVREQLPYLYRNARRMKELIDQILDFRKLEASGMKLQTEEEDIVEFCRRVVGYFQLEAQEERIKLSVSGNETGIKMWFDKEKMEKILSNLLSNALKYTPSEGRVSVNIDRVGENSIEIRVVDTGMGIKREELKRIFERFYQTDQHLAGTGIGLAFTKRLVELHHGEISAESEEGKGTEIIMRFPLDDHHLKPEEMKEGAKWEYKHDERKLSADIQSVKEVSADLYTLLIIEDDKDLRNYLKQIFSGKYNVFWAENGKKGLETALEKMPHLIISDVMMPEMNGIEFCNTLKNDIRISHIPVILLTAKISQEHRIEGYKTGADDYIGKPFDPDLLLARVENMIDSRHKLREKYMQDPSVSAKEVAHSPADESFLLKMEGILVHRMKDPDFDVASLAKEMGMSYSTFNRKIKSFSDRKAKDLILDIRLKKSLELLSEGMSVSEVAFEVGFNDANYFTKCFKKKFGKVPSQYFKL